MMAEPYLGLLTTLIEDLEISTLRGVSLDCRHFFSGAALYANGKICASHTPVGFGLKLPEEARVRLLEGGDGDELRYFKNAPIKKEYVLLSKKILQDPEQLSALLLQSIGYVLD